MGCKCSTETRSGDQQQQQGLAPKERLQAKLQTLAAGIAEIWRSGLSYAQSLFKEDKEQEARVAASGGALGKEQNKVIIGDTPTAPPAQTGGFGNEEEQQKRAQELEAKRKENERRMVLQAARLEQQRREESERKKAESAARRALEEDISDALVQEEWHRADTEELEDEMRSMLAHDFAAEHAVVLSVFRNAPAKGAAYRDKAAEFKEAKVQMLRERLTECEANESRSRFQGEDSEIEQRRILLLNMKVEAQRIREILEREAEKNKAWEAQQEARRAAEKRRREKEDEERRVQLEQLEKIQKQKEREEAAARAKQEAERAERERLIAAEKREADKKRLEQERELAERKAKLEAEAREREAQRREKELQRLREEEARRAAEEKRRREAEEREAHLKKEATSGFVDGTADSGDDDDDDDEEEVKLMPTVKGTVTELFEKLNMQKIVDKDGNWAFFNGTSDRELHVTWTFGPTSTVTPLGTTKYNKQEDGWHQFIDVIFPGNTNMFMSGKPNGWKSSYTATGLGAEYTELVKKEREGKLTKEVNAVKKIAQGIPQIEHHGKKCYDEEAILQVCRRDKIPYIDLNFLPDASAIAMESKSSIPFARPAWYLPKGLKPRLVKNVIEPNDIDQGQLGDCWFVSAVAAVSEFPEKILDIFSHPSRTASTRKRLLKAERSCGAFRVCLNVHGWWENIIVDELLPALQAPIFARNKDEPNELWVSMLEKAFAKINGSYAAIVAGDAACALRDLTGFSTSSFNVTPENAKKNDALFRQLQEADDAGYLMCISCPGQESNITTKYKDVGLVTGHAYSLLRVVTSGEFRLVQIRNPWGSSTEWNGDWSDESEKWKKHPEMAKLCNFKPMPDGTFWMSWEDCTQYFSSGDLCYVKNNWYDYRIRGTMANNDGSVMLEITVRVPVEMFLVASQISSRADPNYKKKAIVLTLCKPTSKRASRSSEEDVKYENVACTTMEPLSPAAKPTFMFARDVSMLQRLTPQQEPYLVILREFDKNTTFPYVLGIISDKPCGDAFSVTFAHMPTDCRFLKNFPKFSYAPRSGTGKGLVKAEYQLNTDRGAPISTSGTSIEPEKL